MKFCSHDNSYFNVLFKIFDSKQKRQKAQKDEKLVFQKKTAENAELNKTALKAHSQV